MEDLFDKQNLFAVSLFPYLGFLYFFNAIGTNAATGADWVLCLADFCSGDDSRWSICATGIRRRVGQCRLATRQRRIVSDDFQYFGGVGLSASGGAAAAAGK